MFRYGLLTVTLALALAACASPRAVNSPSPTGTSVTTATYVNAFTYCQAVGTIDHPDSRYTGPQPPPAVIAGLMRAFGVSANAYRSQAFLHGTYWRCMDGRVYACTIGANLPCESRANTNRDPTPGEREFCAAHPGSDFIPMYITGHNTIYDWRCHDAQAVAGKAISKVDARGYISDIWYLITPSLDRRVLSKYTVAQPFSVVR